MNRFFPALGACVLAAWSAGAVTLYVAPDVPLDHSGTTFLPSDIARYDSGAYALALALPPLASLDAMYRMNGGDWLVSFASPTDLGSSTFLPGDVVRYNGINFSNVFCAIQAGVPAGSNVDAAYQFGGDHGPLVLSFDVPTTIGSSDYDPSDLVEFAPTGPNCGDWGVFGVPFDASAATPPVPISTNLRAAARRGTLTILSFDVPTTLGSSTFVPGQLVSWDGASFGLFEALSDWPTSAIVSGLSFLPDPGVVPSTLTAQRLVQDGSQIRLTWTASCSAGADDYGIYEGTLGSWYSHTEVDCSDDAHDLTEDIGTASGSRYYVVAPRNPDSEGSYGTDSSNFERPPGAAACAATRVISVCP